MHPTDSTDLKRNRSVTHRQLQPQSVRKRYAPQQPLFLYVGRIAHEKNILFLLRAFTALLKKHPLARLLIVGDGPQISDVRAFIAHNELKRNVILTEESQATFCSRQEFTERQTRSSPPVKTENQPMTILEAQAERTALHRCK